MGGAASKAKGSAFERDICAKLSLWITGGKRRDCFWRSAMSGGRATVAHKRGRDVRQAGDITAVAREGHILTDRVFIECKFYKNLDFASFVLENKGVLAKFWAVARKDAERRGKEPWLIARQNRRDTLLLTSGDIRSPFAQGWIGRIDPGCCGRDVVVWRLDDVLSHSPPKEFNKWVTRESSASTSTALVTPIRTVGRERL